MTVHDQSTDLVRQSQAAWTNAADSWAQTVQRMFTAAPGGTFGPFDIDRAVDSWFDLAESLLAVNKEYVKNIARAASSIQSTISEQAEHVGGAVRQQADATTEVMREQTDHLEQARRDEDERAQRAAPAEGADDERAKQAEQEEARREKAEREEAKQEEARREKAEREEAKQERAQREEARRAESKVREELAQKYSDMTKARLQEELDERDLPRTGTVDELRERLVETDLGASAS